MTGVRSFLARWIPLMGFRGSQDYWRRRYRLGGDSGAGSAGSEAAYKAAIINQFVERHGIASVIEFGCGDGQQLALASYRSYLGIDISGDAIRRCRATLGRTGWRFLVMEEYRGERAELALSLDVVYHLVEDGVYFDYLDRLFASAARFVLIYSSDTETSGGTFAHVRHRNVSRDVAERFPGFARIDLNVGDDATSARAADTASFMGYRRA